MVDKTGTLTEGRPVFDQAIGINGYAADVLLRLDASLDQGSEHPLAATLVDAATERRLSLEPVKDFEAIAGLGVRAVMDGKKLALGNTALARSG